MTKQYQTCTRKSESVAISPTVAQETGGKDSEVPVHGNETVLT